MDASYDESTGEWVKLFRAGMWAARARKDEETNRWLISVVDHSGLTFRGEAPGTLTLDEALAEAEKLSPER